MASQLAHIFMQEIVLRADLGVDLHSAAINRTNLPQIRLTPDNPRLEDLGLAFGAPVMMESKLREGSLAHGGRGRRASTYCCTRLARACGSTSSRRAPGCRAFCA